MHGADVGDGGGSEKAARRFIGVGHSSWLCGLNGSSSSFRTQRRRGRGSFHGYILGPLLFFNIRLC